MGKIKVTSRREEKRSLINSDLNSFCVVLTAAPKTRDFFLFTLNSRIRRQREQ